MKLGLLVVVAVAVLLPSFSESRIFTKCELRDKLQKMIKTPRRLDERTLATVICELHRKSHLDTSLVSVLGTRITTTANPTVTTVPPTTGATKMTTTGPIQPTSTSSTTAQLTSTTTTTTNTPTIIPTTNTTTTNTTATNTPTTNTTTTNSTATNTPTTNTTTTNSTATNTPTTNTTTTNSTATNTPTTNTTATNSTATNTPTTNTTATNSTANPATTNSTISSMNTTLVSNSTGGIKRRKREVNSRSGEDMAQYGSQMAGSQEDTVYITNPWSLGLYGLFQLSDGEFCDSGYRQSQNECHTSCTAFIDDDITDDVACAVNTGYLRQIVESASDSCHHTSDFFKECN